MNKFNIGDSVQLKSGGVLMTVSLVRDDGTVFCVWCDKYDNGEAEFKSYSFHPDCLKKG